MKGHPAFHEGVPITSGGYYWTEISAIVAAGLDETIHFEKSRQSRAVIVAQYVAARAIETMRAYDTRPKPTKPKPGKKPKKR